MPKGKLFQEGGGFRIHEPRASVRTSRPLDHHWFHVAHTKIDQTPIRLPDPSRFYSTFQEIKPSGLQ